MILGDGEILVADCNNITKAGTYYLDNNTQHHPIGSGTMLLKVYTWHGFIKQEATRAINGEVYFRTYNQNTLTWTSWYKIGATIVQD